MIPTEHSVNQQMREDWNRRAGEDAYYYVAFGRRAQDREEFLATATAAVRGIESDLIRLPGAIDPPPRRALEIGCGPGRLMYFLGRHFDEIHGVDVSDEMIKLGGELLANFPNAHLHHNSGQDLGMFAANFFDLVYSYAVFQHIPSRDVVLAYLREAARVLKPGGILRCQLNGAPPRRTGNEASTWSGCSFSRDDIIQFAESESVDLVSIAGIDTRYMWISIRKPSGSLNDASRAELTAVAGLGGEAEIVAIRSRPVAFTCWTLGFPVESLGIGDISIQIGGRQATCTYLSPHLGRGGYQINAFADGVEAGAAEIRLQYRGRDAGPPVETQVRYVPPPAPSINSITDGINLLSSNRIETRSVKILLQDIDRPDELRIRLGGEAVEHLEYECYDRFLAQYQYSFELPEAIGSGYYPVTFEPPSLGLPEVTIEVVS